MERVESILPRALILGMLLLQAACSTVMDRVTGNMAGNLSSAILNQEDPETVRDGAPAYLLLMDSLIEGNPESASALRSAANLYSAYGAVFVEDQKRAKRLTRRAHNYGSRAICVVHEPACQWADMDFDSFNADLRTLTVDQLPELYSFTISSLAYTRANSDDWSVLAELPKVESALNRLYELDPDYEGGAVHLYLGILNTIRPPALGGQPEVGREHFEKAIEISGGKDLSVKVEFARSYARLVYDRELHDRLLKEVLAADPVQPGLTLFNTLAQRQAEELLETADDYF
jgi:hypothetical protein